MSRFWQLLSQLEPLLSVFRRPATNLAEATQATVALDELLHEAAKEAAAGRARPDDVRFLTRLIGTAADYMAGLEAALSRQRRTPLPQPVLVQLAAASTWVGVCSEMLQALPCGAEATMRLACAVALLVGPGGRGIAQTLSAGRKDSSYSLAWVAATAVGNAIHLLCTTPGCARGLASLERRWAPPPAFRLWLHAVADTLLMQAEDGGAAEAQSFQPRLHCFISLCHTFMGRTHMVFTQGLLPQLRAAVQADAPLCRKTLTLLLHHALPVAGLATGVLQPGAAPGTARSGGGRGSAASGSDAGGGAGDEASWRRLLVAASLLGADCLEDPLAGYMHGEGGPATFHLAADLIDGWPPGPPHAVEPMPFWRGLVFVICLLEQGKSALALCECCRHAHTPDSTPPSDEVLAAAAWRVVAMAPHAAALLRAVAAAVDAPEAAPSSEAAAGSASGGSAGGGGGAAGQGSLHDGLAVTLQSMCLGFATTFQLALTITEVGNAEQAVACLAVADTGLRLLPLLVAQQERHERLEEGSGGSSDGSAAGGWETKLASSAALCGEHIPYDDVFTALSDLCLGLLHGQLGHLAVLFCRQQLDGQPGAVLPLAPALRRHAATLTRLVHWAAAPQQEQSAVAQVAVGGWQRHLQLAALLFETANVVGTQAVREQASEEAKEVLIMRLRAMSMAHAELVAMTASRCPPDQLLAAGVDAAAVLTAVVALGHSPPTAITPGLVQLVSATLRGMAGCDVRTCSNAALMIQQGAEASPLLCAHLVSTGAPLLLLDAFAAAADGDDLDAAPQAAQIESIKTGLVHALSTILTELANAAKQCGLRAEAADGDDGGGADAPGAASGSSSGSPSPGGELVLAAGALAVACGQAAQQPGASAGAVLAAVKQAWEAALEPASRVAAQLLEVFARPEEQQPAWLQAAQAAASRSCAYLRCANLAEEGGPDAGEGAGSSKCGACRVSWYCNETCSHADWRQGGHRKLCKLLRAEREERRLQAAAQQ